jgi:multiple sugar transport system permease protein
MSVAESTLSPDKPATSWARLLHRLGRSNIEGLLFIAPVAIGVVTFQLVPMVVSAYASLTSWDGLTSPVFVGFDNYTAFLRDPLFRTTLKNTIIFTAGSIPLTVVLAFLLALLCNRPLRGVSWFRTAYFAPFVTNVVAISLVWFWFYDPEQGVLNGLLSMIGVEGPAWLSDSAWAMPAVILVSVWQGLGYPMIVLLAGLQAIPASLYDAAKVDGAGAVGRVRHITLPLLTPSIFFVVITQFITSFQVFGIIFVMTQGGPGNATNVYIYYLYQNAFAFGRMGYASGMAWVLVAIVVTLTVIQWRLQKRWVFYE